MKWPKSQFELYAVILCVLWAALGSYIAVTGHIVTGIALPLIFGPLTYLLFVFMDVRYENSRNSLVVENMRDTMNDRVGVFTVENLVDFEDKFNKERPDNMWHEVQSQEQDGIVTMHVVHYVMDNAKPEWNSEVTMKFDSEKRTMISWEMRLAKGAAKFTDNPKTREEKDADVIYGP